MKITIQKRHKSNGKRLVTVCNYGYFLPRGKWEAIVIKVFKWQIWIWRKAKYRNEWPVSCA